MSVDDITSGRVQTRRAFVADEGVPARTLAEIIGRHLGLPVTSITSEEADDHFGWIGWFFQLGKPISSARTQELLGWTPTGTGLVDDLEHGHWWD